MSDVTRDGRDAERELPGQVVKRDAVQGSQQAPDLLAGLLAEYPRDEAPRHVTDTEVDFATARRRP